MLGRSASLLRLVIAGQSKGQSIIFHFSEYLFTKAGIYKSKS
jgi:hypothetical protein